jgi:hypothetical protein
LYSTASGLYAGGRFSIADFLPASRVAFYNGSSWSQVGTGIGGNSSYVKTISEYGGRVIFGGSFTSAGGVSANNIAAWGAPLNVKLLNSKVPEHFYLSQNYPNPFNPSTTIRFGVPENEHVRIEIHDVLGKEAGLLVNEKMSPGVYEVVWPAPSGDASNYPSGIYFCKLTAGDYNDVKKMIFLK